MLEDRVSREEEKWQTLVALWPGFVLTLDGDDRLTFVTRNAYRIDSERDIGRDFFDFVSVEARAALRADLAAVRAGQAVLVRRARTRLADGTWRWFESRFVSFHERSVMLIGRDVTDEEVAKIALRLLAVSSREFSEATEDYDRLLLVIAR